MAHIRTGLVEGLASVTIENARVRLTVLPALGGRIHELVDLVAGRDLLWHNERTRPRAAPYGAHFDDWWSGGWDEIFPSGDYGLFRGERLPYMGELWCVPWTAEVTAAAGVVSVTTTALGTIAPVRFERTVTLRNDEPIVLVDYRIESLDVQPLSFTWGIHPAFAVTSNHRIDHPGTTMLVGVSSDPSIGVEGGRYRWPSLPDPQAPGGANDMRRVRSREAAVFGGHWALDLPTGWLALTDTRIRRGIAIVFDAQMFRHAWLWMVYGGWRAHHHVALEPWTGFPQAVQEAEQAGQARTLAPGEVLETEVAFVLFEGLDGVQTVEQAEDSYRVR